MPKKSPAKPALWQHKEGGRGFTVVVEERAPGGLLYLRHRDPVKRNWATPVKLGHSDRELAKTQAADFAHSLRMGRVGAATGKYDLSTIFALYERDVSPAKKGRGAQADARRMDLWERFLGKDFDVSTLTPQRLKNFLAERKAGRLIPAEKINPETGKRGRGAKVSAKPSDTTIGNDVRFLQTVLTWAAGEGYIPLNPIRDFSAPRNAMPKRPVATYDRYLRVRPHCTGLFGPFLDLVESLGWRVSALRQLMASDLDLSSRPAAPFGRILKRAETDKRGVEMWVPLPQDARAAIDATLTQNPVVGDAFLFPAPKMQGKKPWGERYVWGLLRRAETSANVEHLERGAFHPYRRKWRRERKHLPRADVAAAGGWLTVQTLDLYDGADDATLLEVVSEPRKLREVR